jgi:hypothetical protein
MYAVILAMLMILELAGLIMAFVYKGKLREVYETTLFKSLDKALEEKDEKAIKAFEELENTIKCCGVHNVSDYDRRNRTRSAYCTSHSESEGCADAIVNFLNGKLPIIGGLLGGVLALEIFGLIGAIVLAKTPTDDDGDSKKSRMLTPRRFRK